MPTKLKAGVGLTVDRAGKFDAFDLLHEDVKRLNSEAKKSSTQLKALRKNSDSTVGSITNLTRTVGAGAVAFGAWRLGGRADELRLLESRIMRVTEVTGDYAAVNQELTRIAFDNGVALKGTADLFINIQRAAADLGKTNEQSLQLTNTIQQLGVISGASTQEMSNSLRQFSQAMAGGIVRAEEWNSIVENTPEIANRIAQGMGKTVGELRLMVIEGKVLSEDVFDTLLNQTDAIQADFEKMPLTIGRATSQLNQNFDKVLDVINKSTGATESFAAVMNYAAVELGNLTNQQIDDGLSVGFEVIGAAAVLMSSRIVGSYATTQTARIADTVARSRAATLALVDNAKVAQSEKMKELALLKSAQTTQTVAAAQVRVLQARSVHDGKAVRDAGLLVAARNKLTAANTALAAAEGRVAVATNVYSSAANKAAISTRLLAGSVGGLRAGMALLGGPIGVVLTGLAGLYYWHSKNKDEISSLNENIKLSNGAYSTHNDVLLKAVGLSDSFTNATKTKRAEVKGEIQDLILNTQSHIENQRAVLSALKARQTAYLEEARIAKSRLNPNSNLTSQGFDDLKTNLGNDRFEEEIKAQNAALVESDGLLLKLQERYDGLGKVIPGVSVKTNINSGSLKSAADAAKSLKNSQDSLLKSYESEIASLDRRELALTATATQLKAYDLAQKTFGKNQLTYTQQQINEIVNRENNIVSLESEKKAREAVNKAAKDALDAIAKENKERELGFSLIKGLTEEESKAQAIKKKLWEEQDKYNESIKTANKELQDLIESNDNINNLVQDGVKLTESQYKTYDLLNKSKKELYLTELKHQELQEKSNEKSEAYNEQLKQTNAEIEANNILLTQGQKAYEKHIFYLKYGKDANYEFAKSQQANLDIQRKQIEAWNGVKDSMFDAITSGVDLLPELEAGIKKVTDSLLDAVAGSGSFSDVLGNVGGLFNTGNTATSFAGLSGNFSTGSGLTSLFTDSQASQIGGGLGSAAGSAIVSSLGSSIGSVLGSAIPVVGTLLGGFVGSLFEGDPRITIGQDVYANDVEGSLGADRRFSGAGFYSDATTRESAFGEFGALGSGRTKRISSEDMAGVEQALDLMVALDNSIYDLSSEAARQNVSDGLDLSHIRSDGSAEELLQERIDILLANTDSYVSALVDTSLSVEDQIARITDLAVISNDVIPALQELGFNIGDIETVTLPAAASLIDLAGGLDQLDSLRSNYLDKVLSDEEKLANTYDYHEQTIDGLNQKLGLAGNATISTVSGLQMLIQGLETSGAVTTEVGRENLLAAYASADAFAYMRDEQNALNEQVLALNTAFTDLSSPLSLINAGLAESRQSLVDYAGGLSELNSLMSGYISSVYSADEQELIGVGQSALALQALNAELGLTGINAIDTRQELKDLFNSINNETALAVESNRELLVKLAGLGADVAAVEDSDFSSASDALAQLPADLLSVVSPLEDTVSAFDDVVNTQLPAAVEYTSEIADNINNIIAPDFSNSLQSQIDLQKESNRLAQENLAAQNRNEALLSQINSSQSQLASNSSYELGRG